MIVRPSERSPGAGDAETGRSYEKPEISLAGCWNMCIDVPGECYILHQDDCDDGILARLKSDQTVRGGCRFAAYRRGCGGIAGTDS